METRLSPPPTREPIASDGVTTFDLYPTWQKWFALLYAEMMKPVPEYVDNAAALAGGLVAGDKFRTGDDLKVVH